MFLELFWVALLGFCESFLWGRNIYFLRFVTEIYGREIVREIEMDRIFHIHVLLIYFIEDFTINWNRNSQTLRFDCYNRNKRSEYKV